MSEKWRPKFHPRIFYDGKNEVTSQVSEYNFTILCMCLCSDTGPPGPSTHGSVSSPAHFSLVSQQHCSLLSPPRPRRLWPRVVRTPATSVHAWIEPQRSIGHMSTHSINLIMFNCWFFCFTFSCRSFVGFYKLHIYIVAACIMYNYNKFSK